MIWEIIYDWILRIFQINKIGGIDTIRDEILIGREIIDNYHEAHLQLYSKPWHKGIPEEHTPLLNLLLYQLKEAGFNSIQEFFNSNYEQNLIDTGIYDNDIYKFREDLEMIGTSEEYQGVELKHENDEVKLLIDGEVAMSTHILEHISMLKYVVEDCPDNARIFLGGLGVGLVLLYLKQSGKVKEIIICEKDERVIELLKPKIINYLSEMPIQIIQGDIFEEIKKLGKFDWIFSDINESQLEDDFKSIAQMFLTEDGVYTNWKPFEVRW